MFPATPAQKARRKLKQQAKAVSAQMRAIAQVKGKMEVRGMSARYGEYLALRCAQKDMIAQVIVAHLRKQASGCSSPEVRPLSDEAQSDSYERQEDAA